MVILTRFPPSVKSRFVVGKRVAVRRLRHVIKACAGSGSSCGQDQCQDKGADSQRCFSNDHLHKFLHILVLSLSCILR